MTLNQRREYGRWHAKLHRECRPHNNRWVLAILAVAVSGMALLMMAAQA